MVTHGQPWPNVTLWQRLSQYETQPWASMINHSPMLHCDKDCLNMKINHVQPLSKIIKDGQSWSNITLWQILSQYENQPWSTMVQCRIMTKVVSIWKSIMVKHGQSWSIWKLSMVNHGEPQWTIVQHHIVTKIVSIWKSTMINHCQPWSTMFQCQIVTKIVSTWK